MDLNTLSTSLDLLSLSELQKAKDLINVKVNSTAPFHVSSFVHVQNDFISFELSSDIQEDLWKRIKEPGQNSSPNSVRYLWLSKTQGCYKFSGHEMLTPLPFKENDPLLRVMAMINRTLPWHQWLDSCLLAFYLNGEIGVNFHDDDEIDINQDCPIKNVSLSEGDSTRNILFKAKAGSNFTGSLDLTLANCSLMTMEPGCQKGFLHSVPPQNINKGRRILLSYRKAADPAIVKLLRQAPLSQAKTTVSRRKSLPPVPDKPFVQQDPPPRDAQPDPSPAITKVTSSPKPPLTLILGTSITVDLDLGPNTRNLSTRGATLSDLTQIIKDHKKTGIDAPEKIVIHGGTKDLLKRSTHKAQKLKPVLEELLQTTKDLYPSAKVLFVSMLPIDAEKRCQNNRVPPQDIPLVPGKVLAFNRLARYLCKIHRVYHVHALKSFLFRDGDSIDPTLFNDHIHLSHKGTAVMNGLVNHHLRRLSEPARRNPTPRTPMSLMVPPPAPPTSVLLDPSPEKLSESTPLDSAPIPTSSSSVLRESLSNVSSEVEITYPPAVASSPSPSSKRGSSDTSPKSLTLSILEKFGVSSILAPDSKLKPD